MTKSNMPQGTRLAALLALCLAACLLAWRGNTLLTEDPSASVAATPELARVTSLLDPVLGRGTTRIAAHTYWLGDEQGAVQLECSATDVVRRELGADPIVQTNHCLDAAHQQRHRQHAVLPLAVDSDLPGVGADGQRALAGHDLPVATR